MFDDEQSLYILTKKYSISKYTLIQQTNKKPIKQNHDIGKNVSTCPTACSFIVTDGLCFFSISNNSNFVESMKTKLLQTENRKHTGHGHGSVNKALIYVAGHLIPRTYKKKKKKSLGIMHSSKPSDWKGLEGKNNPWYFG